MSFIPLSDYQSPNFQRRKYKDIREDGKIFTRYRVKGDKVYERWEDPQKFALKLKRQYKNYRSKHRDAILLYNKNQRSAKPEQYGNYDKNNYSKHKEKIILTVKKYTDNNRDKIRTWERSYRAKKKLLDPNISILSALRSRLRHALSAQNSVKTTRSNDLLGCNQLTLIKHLESQFTSGMTWSNRGIRGWHIDHIKPCSRFDLTQESQQRACFHYTNLQPLWAIDNIRKSNKIINTSL